MSKEQWLKENRRKGEEYAGLILGKDGQPDHHVFLLLSESESINYEDAKKQAKKVGGDLPTRREQSLLFANLKEHFKPSWYWSCEQRAASSGCAWGQHFYYGNQLSIHKSNKVRARFVRRLPI